jgi:hypothetical protein
MTSTWWIASDVRDSRLPVTCDGSWVGHRQGHQGLPEVCSGGEFGMAAKGICDNMAVVFPTTRKKCFHVNKHKEPLDPPDAAFLVKQIGQESGVRKWFAWPAHDWGAVLSFLGLLGGPRRLHASTTLSTFRVCSGRIRVTHEDPTIAHVSLENAGFSACVYIVTRGSRPIFQPGMINRCNQWWVRSDR